MFLTLFSFSFAFGQANYGISNFSLVIKGTSNLHDWQSKANEVRIGGTMTQNTGELKSIHSLSVDVPVRSIKSEKGTIMDNKTYDALMAGTYPNISFKLEKVNSLNKKGNGYDINTSGYLTIAGTTNKIDLYVTGSVDGNGYVTFKGSQKLKMTDYKIKPPTALLGTLTTGNEVEIVFQVTLKPY